MLFFPTTLKLESSVKKIQANISVSSTGNGRRTDNDAETDQYQISRQTPGVQGTERGCPTNLIALIKRKGNYSYRIPL